MPENLHTLWLLLLERDPGRPVLIPSGRPPWTAEAIESLVAVRTTALKRIPRLRGRLVGLALPNGPDWLATFLAILRCEAVVLPMETGSVQPEAMVRSVRGTALVDRTGLRSWSTRRPALPPEICIAKLSSGITGTPKTFLFTHSEMEADGRQVQQGMGIGPADINFAVIPFGHSYGLGSFIMPLLRSGCPIATGRSILPHEVAEDLTSSGATVFPAVPPLIRALAETGLSGELLANLRLVICAGSRLPGEIAVRFADRFHLRVHGFYGSTETGGISFDREGEDTLTGRSVGQPLPGVRVKRTRSGRLEVSSAAVHSQGNRRRDPSGLPSVLLTDLGGILDDGTVALHGRGRGFVKRGGRRISLGETEAAVLAMPRVSQAWAFVLHRINGEEDLGLVIETTLTPAEARTALRERLPKWKRPARLICLPDFPLNLRGKVDTGALLRLVRNPD